MLRVTVGVRAVRDALLVGREPLLEYVSSSVKVSLSVMGDVGVMTGAATVTSTNSKATSSTDTLQRSDFMFRSSGMRLGSNRLLLLVVKAMLGFSKQFFSKTSVEC